MAFQEYPKSMYYPDGRTISVRTADEEVLYTAAGWSLVPTTTTPGIRRVPASAMAVVWLAPNPKRKTLKLVNDSAAIARFKYGAGALVSDFSWVLDPGERWEMPLLLVDGTSQPEWLGQITGYWESAVGNVQITELEFA
jgi:hypothetical protein